MWMIFTQHKTPTMWNILSLVLYMRKLKTQASYEICQISKLQVIELKVRLAFPLPRLCCYLIFLAVLRDIDCLTIYPRNCSPKEVGDLPEANSRANKRQSWDWTQAHLSFKCKAEITHKAFYQRLKIFGALTPYP